jgi:hypothetical protein
VRFQSGSMSIIRLGLSFLWEWTLYMACSRADVIFSGYNSGSDIVMPLRVVLVSGSNENISFSGSSE